MMDSILSYAFCAGKDVSAMRKTPVSAAADELAHICADSRSKQKYSEIEVIRNYSRVVSRDWYTGTYAKACGLGSVALPAPGALLACRFAKPDFCPALFFGSALADRTCRQLNFCSECKSERSVVWFRWASHQPCHLQRGTEDAVEQECKTKTK